MKKYRLLTAAIAAMVSASAFAQTTIDYTSKFGVKNTDWLVGPSTTAGVCATQFAPQITTNDGRTANMVERYETNVNTVGEIIWQSHTDLTPGTYTIEIYGNAFFTSGRGFDSPMADGATDVAYLFTETHDEEGNAVRDSMFIEAKITTATDANSLRTLENIVVGSDGYLKVGIGKAQAGTNWHTVNIKGVTAIVSDDAALADAKAALLEVIEAAQAYQYVDISEAIATAQDVYDNSTSVDEVEAAADALQGVIDNNADAEAIGANTAAVAGATEENPVATSFIVNGTFDSGTAPWVTTTGAQNKGTATNQTGAFNVPYWENWNGSAFTGKMYQTVNNIPNGTYRLDIAAFVNNFDASAQHVYANSDQTALTAAAPTLYSVYTYVENNTVEVGFEQTTAVANWCGIDNAVLYYLTSENVVDKYSLDPYKAQLAELVETANNDLTNLTLSKAGYTALSQAITTYNKEYTTADEYVTAIGGLTQAIKNAEALSEAILSYQDLYNAINTLYNTDYIELVEGAHDALKTALQTAAVQGQAITSADELPALETSIKSAALDYVEAADPAEGVQFDLTFLLTNPDVTDFWDGSTWNVKPDGWYNEQSGGNFQVMGNEEMGPGGEVFMEYWSATAATNGFVLCQKVTLPAGTYQMTGRVGARQYDGNGSTTNVTFSANDVDGTLISYGTLQDGQLDFVQTEECEVSIGLKAHTGNNARWMGINKIHLYKVTTNNIVMSEDEDFVPVSEAGNVTLTRTFKAGQWNAVVLPFSLTAAQIEEAFGAETTVANFVESVSDETVSIDFAAMETPAIQANVPVLIKPANAVSEINLEGITVAPVTNDLTVSGTAYKFVGSYLASNTLDAGDYYISGGQFWKASAATAAMKGFRAVIKPVSSEAEAKLVAITINGVPFEDATAITGVKAQNANDAIYTIQGVKVNKLQKGINIVNGKKVYVK